MLTDAYLRGICIPPLSRRWYPWAFGPRGPIMQCHTLYHWCSALVFVVVFFRLLGQRTSNQMHTCVGLPLVFCSSSSNLPDFRLTTSLWSWKFLSTHNSLWLFLRRQLWYAILFNDRFHLFSHLLVTTTLISRRRSSWIRNSNRNDFPVPAAPVMKIFFSRLERRAQPVVDRHWGCHNFLRIWILYRRSHRCPFFLRAKLVHVLRDGNTNNCAFFAVELGSKFPGR